jgi:hypothetical protein
MNKFSLFFAVSLMISLQINLSIQKGKMYENPEDIIMSHRLGPGEKDY